ncbi:MAG: FAD-dependent oxidoreductase [Solirubrobacterales bacterium]
MKKRIVIVGGVAGGASAAARLRRLDEDAEIIMFERGPDISYANCGLPYYVGNVINDRYKLLVQTPQGMSRRFGLDVRVLSEVIRINREAKTVEVRDLQSGNTYTERYDVLILSPGARPLLPNIPGVTLPSVFTIRNVPDSDRIKQWIEQQRPEHVVVVGGGFIGLEMVENLLEHRVQVSLVEMSAQVMPPLDPEMAALVHRVLRRQGVELFLSEQVTELVEIEQVTAVRLASGKELRADMVIVGAGNQPETALAAEAGLALGATGGIAVDEHLRTSDEAVYAVGDAIEVRSFVGGQPALIPLAGPANRQGRLVADIICGREAKYEGTLGTAIAKLFDLVIANTGMNEKRLRAAGRKYQVSYTHPAAHATYYPGGVPMAMKLIFDPENGAILGAQIIGAKGVDKRIDVLAAAIRKNLTVFDLQELELAYAPPFSSAKDPVNMAGYVAGNIIRGDMAVFHWHEVQDLAAKGGILVDVRTPAEFREETIPGSINIPVDVLRERLSELPADRPLLIFCRVGLRGYLASRILTQHGFKDVKNLSGGWLTYEPAING